MEATALSIASAALDAALLLWAASTTLATVAVATYALISALKDDAGTLRDTLCLTAALAASAAPAWAVIWVRDGIPTTATNWLCLAIETALATAALAALVRHEAADEPTIKRSRTL
ncbi:hypothetical protein ACQFYA_21145 [Promicromonospora sp. Marseille-Q5078]